MTPDGDAARLWASLAASFALAIVLAINTSNQAVWTLSYLGGLVFFLLAFTVGAMLKCSKEDLREWALYQNKPRSRWRKMVLMSSGKLSFGGRAGFATILSMASFGLVCALLLIPTAGAATTAPDTFVVYSMSIVGVISSWAFLHVAFALQYATLYYGPGGSTGFDFPGGGEPGIVDFAYFAFTLGTSFAVSDVLVTSSRIRKAVLVHSILAFFYNAAILALVINIVVSAL